MRGQWEGQRPWQTRLEEAEVGVPRLVTTLYPTGRPGDLGGKWQGRCGDYSLCRCEHRWVLGLSEARADFRVTPLMGLPACVVSSETEACARYLGVIEIRGPGEG